MNNIKVYDRNETGVTIAGRSPRILKVNIPTKLISPGTQNLRPVDASALKCNYENVKTTPSVV